MLKISVLQCQQVKNFFENYKNTNVATSKTLRITDGRNDIKI